jgi:hypothetical protein
MSVLELLREERGRSVDNRSSDLNDRGLNRTAVTRSPSTLQSALRCTSFIYMAQTLVNGSSPAARRDGKVTTEFLPSSQFSPGLNGPHEKTEGCWENGRMGEWENGRATGTPRPLSDGSPSTFTIGLLRSALPGGSPLTGTEFTRAIPIP